MISRILLLLILFFISSCGGVLVAEEETVFSEDSVTKAELQSRVQRFAGVFIDRTSQALTVLESDLKNEEDKREILKRLLAYSSSAIEIASGTTPEVSLLDMVVFVTLINDRWDGFWRPKVFRPNSKVVSEEFEQSEREIWAILREVSTKEQRDQLADLILKWAKDNQDQILVERVRINDIAFIEGEASERRAEKITGAFTTIKGAVSTADQTLFLANRAMFLAQRYPFILRLEARLGVQETLIESLALFDDKSLKLDGASELTNSIGDTASAVGDASLKIKSTLEAYRDAFPADKGPSTGKEASTIEKMNKAIELTEEVNQLASYLRGGGIQAQEAMEDTSNSVQSVIWSVTFGGILFSLLSAVFWWGGYLLVKTRARKD